jgi:putative transposase
MPVGSCAGRNGRPISSWRWVKRSTEQVGFAVIRRRWVIERTFAWIVKNRRFVRDYEQLTTVAETLITIAASATLIRRWP